MRNRTAALVLAASALCVAPATSAQAVPVPHAGPVVTADDKNESSDLGKWGLAGLAGLLGLAGLAQAGRKRVDERDGRYDNHTRR